MAETVVVAVFNTKEGKEEALAEGLRNATEQTHQEEGCLLYALHRDVQEPTRFALIERWRSREDLDAHLQQPYITALGEIAGEILADPPQVHIMEPAPAGDGAKGALASS